MVRNLILFGFWFLEISIKKKKCPCQNRIFIKFKLKVLTKRLLVDNIFIEINTIINVPRDTHEQALINVINIIISEGNCIKISLNIYNVIKFLFIIYSWVA